MGNYIPTQISFYNMSQSLATASRRAGDSIDPGLGTRWVPFVFQLENMGLAENTLPEVMYFMSCELMGNNGLDVKPITGNNVDDGKDITGGNGFD